MAFSIDLDTKKTFEFVCSKDGALDMTRDEFEEYLKDPENKELLRYRDGLGYEDTTRFVLRCTLPTKAAEKVLGKQLSDGQISMLYMMEEIKWALTDIINPADAEKPFLFKRDGEGCAMPDIVAGLYNAGVLFEFVAARKAVSGDSEQIKDLTKKKLKQS